MADLPKWVQRAMDIAIKRVRFENAYVRLPETPFPQDDTEKIREATKVYIETWVVPLLKAVRDNDRGTGESMS
jgi:hypothetical protein